MMAEVRDRPCGIEKFEWNPNRLGEQPYRILPFLRPIEDLLVDRHH